MKIQKYLIAIQESVHYHQMVREQIEPSLEEYEEYWEQRQFVTKNFIENDQNCVLWSAFYLWWYKYGEDELFPSSLMDLEIWFNNKEKVNELLYLLDKNCK